MEFDILWDEPTKARRVVCSFDANGNKVWMEAVIGQIKEMKVTEDSR